MSMLDHTGNQYPTAAAKACRARAASKHIPPSTRRQNLGVTHVPAGNHRLTRATTGGQKGVQHWPSLQYGSHVWLYSRCGPESLARAPHQFVVASRVFVLLKLCVKDLQWSGNVRSTEKKIASSISAHKVWRITVTRASGENSLLIINSGNEGTPPTGSLLTSNYTFKHIHTIQTYSNTFKHSRTHSNTVKHIQTHSNTVKHI